MNAGRYFTIAEKKAVLCPLIESLCHDFNPFLYMERWVSFLRPQLLPQAWGLKLPYDDMDQNHLVAFHKFYRQIGLKCKD